MFKVTLMDAAGRSVSVSANRKYRLKIPINNFIERELSTFFKNENGVGLKLYTATEEVN
jgi:hypothetical protein